MYKSIYLLRHGSTKDNELGINGSQTDTPLSEKGLLQAKNAVTNLSKYNFDLIFVSQLTRTYQTIKPYLETLEKPPRVITEPLTIERNLGIFTNTLASQGLIGEDIVKSGLSKTEWKPKNGESTLDVTERAKKFYQVLKEAPAYEILICGHQNFLRCLELLILEREVNDENFFSENPPRLDNGEIRKYTLKNN